MNKSGIPRLRASVPAKDYSFMSQMGAEKYLSKMVVKRTSGQIVTIPYPRISKGSKQGKYVPRYITIPAEEVKKYGFKPHESVFITVEW